MDGLRQLLAVVSDFGDGPDAVGRDTELREHDEVLNERRGHSHLTGTDRREDTRNVREGDQWEYES